MKARNTEISTCGFWRFKKRFGKPRTWSRQRLSRDSSIPVFCKGRRARRAFRSRLNFWRTKFPDIVVYMPGTGLQLATICRTTATIDHECSNYRGGGWLLTHSSG